MAFPVEKWRCERAGGVVTLYPPDFRQGGVMPSRSTGGLGTETQTRVSGIVCKRAPVCVCGCARVCTSMCAARVRSVGGSRIREIENKGAKKKTTKGRMWYCNLRHGWLQFHYKTERHLKVKIATSLQKGFLLTFYSCKQIYFRNEVEFFFFDRMGYFRIRDCVELEIVSVWCVCVCFGFGFWFWFCFWYTEMNARCKHGSLLISDKRESHLFFLFYA